MTIREMRKELKLTQVKIGEILGVPSRTIQKWESGESNLSLWKENLIIRILKDYSNGIIYEPKSKTIKEARTKAGLTQKQIFEKFGIPITTIHDWEVGTSNSYNWVQKMVIIAIENL